MHTPTLPAVLTAPALSKADHLKNISSLQFFLEVFVLLLDEVVPDSGHNLFMLLLSVIQMVT